MSRPRSRTRKESRRTSSVSSSPGSSWRMAAPLPTTTSRRSPLSTWCSASAVARRSVRRRPTPSRRRSSTRRRRLCSPFSSSTSDWNPDADLQAMARAHRLGQTNKVMIFRLITRGTIEERMMQMTKKKMVLEHLVVGKLKNQSINQEQLDDIIRYGSKELFADDNDESVKSRQIHYDETAIDRLLDRDQVGDEETLLDDEEEDGFLKAFKVANFEYVDEAEVAAEEESPVPPSESKASVNSTERSSFWEDLLRDKYEVHKVEEFNAMGKGKRSRKQMVSVEEDDLAGLEDVSSDGEDDNYEAELTDNETPSVGAAAVRRPYRKRSRDTSEAIPLMEGEGRFLRVMGFNQSQRAVFVQILMRFGVGKFDWAEFVPRLKQKTLEEIKEYGKLFMEHISEEITDSPTFSDNVPKEGLRIDDVLVRIGTLSLIRDKIKAFSAGSPIFPNDILSRYPGLKGGRLWNEHHDKLLLQAVMKHGYGRWQAIVDDKDLRIQEVICQEMNLPFISTPALGAPQVQNVSSGTSQPQVHPLGTSQAQSSASGVSQPHVPAPGSSQPQNGVNSEHAEAPGIEAKGTTPGSESAADAAHGATDTASRSQLSQDQSTMYHFREMQRRLVEFVKKRVLLLEKGLNAELQKEYYAEDKTNGVPNDDTGRKVTDIATPCSEALDTKKIDQLPQVEIISPSEITTVACDKKQDRLDMANLFNEMSRIVINTAPNSAETCYGPASLELRKNLAPLQDIGDEMNKILSLEQTSSPCDKLAPKVDHNADDTTLGAGAMDIDTAADKTNQEANPGSESNNVSGAESAGDGCADVEVEEKQEDEIIIDDNCSVSGGVCEALTIAFSMIGEIYSRVGASLPVEIWKSVVEALRKVMDILASKSLLLEDNIVAMFYIELLHCLHLVLAEPRGYLTDHVAGFVAALRIFFRYGLVNKPSVMNQATNHMKGVGSTSQNIPFEVSNQSKSGPYRPPHLRKKIAVIMMDR